MAVRGGGFPYMTCLENNKNLPKGPNLGRTIWYFLLFFCSASVEVKIPNGFGTQHGSGGVSKRVEQLRFICTVHPTVTCDLPDVFW